MAKLDLQAWSLFGHLSGNCWACAGVTDIMLTPAYPSACVLPQVHTCIFNDFVPVRFIGSWSTTMEQTPYVSYVSTSLPGAEHASSHREVCRMGIVLDSTLKTMVTPC